MTEREAFTFRTEDIQDITGDDLKKIFGALQTLYPQDLECPPALLLRHPEVVIKGIRLLLQEIGKGKDSRIRFLDSTEARAGKGPETKIATADDICRCGISVRQAAIQILSIALCDPDMRKKAAIKVISGGNDIDLKLFFSTDQLSGMTPIASKYINYLANNRSSEVFGKLLAALVQFSPEKLSILGDTLTKIIFYREAEAIAKLSIRQLKVLVECSRDFSIEDIKAVREL